MTTAAYQQWVAAGRPTYPATITQSVVARLKKIYPQAVFSWYTNEEHLLADPPEDHTPFSATGWPSVSPRWFVFATDIMHEPAKGVDCNSLFAYWIVEARAGRMPFLKYIIWQGHIYDARFNWVPQSAIGHFDHIHLSFRTDWVHRALPDGWLLTPDEQPDAPPTRKVPTMYIGRVPNGGEFLITPTFVRPIHAPAESAALQKLGIVPVMISDAELQTITNFIEMPATTVTLSPTDRKDISSQIFDELIDRLSN